MKSLPILLTTFLLMSCTGDSTKQTSILDSTNSITKNGDTNKLIITHSLIPVSSGSKSFYKTVNLDGINFQLVRDINDDTSFLGTFDKSFSTPEGYSIGISFQNIKKLYRSKMKKEEGWGYYINLPSKWTLVFHVGTTATDHPPFDTSKVTYICRRNF